MARMQWRLVAEIVKSHGRSGEVVATPVAGLPPLLYVGLHVACVPPQLRRNRFHTIVHTSSEGAGQLIGLSDVDNISEAQELVGCSLLAPVYELPKDLPPSFDELLERQVIDRRYGDLGVITHILEGPANNVWVVQKANKEVLVPAVDTFIKELPTQGPIVVELPSGLVEERR